jgi:2-keto-4-pentenoate hydratase/2-oxohepta-3-ene-1,7-dioic acid hydratase in catechol pathway
LPIEILQVTGPLLRFRQPDGQLGGSVAYTPGRHAGPFAIGMFADGRHEFAGLVAGGRVCEVGADTGALLEDWDEALRRLAEQAAGNRRGPLWRSLDEDLRVLPPVRPGQILQSGANYRQHVIDLHVAEGGDRAEAEAIMDARAADGEPYIFAGLPSAMCGPADDVILPVEGTQHDWEVEIAVVIGKPARRISREKAMRCVAGYTICNDITTRDLVYRPDLRRIGTDWTRAKNRPTFLPTGPYLVPAAFAGDPAGLLITLRHNGVVRQNELAKDMIFDIPRLVSYASALVPLSPGDLLLTGSPAGNGAHWGVFLAPGDHMEAEITGLGRQRNACVSERLTSHA